MTPHDPRSRHPCSRREGVLSRTVGHETVVYDPVHHEAHCLNAPAAFVWQHADGTRSVAELAREMADHLDMPCDEEWVRLALAELQQANLLVETSASDPVFQPDRRQALATLARYSTLALLVPAVTSVVVPTAAASSSCLGPGEFCASGIECCSGICFAGMCTA